MTNRFTKVPNDILIYMALSYDLPEILSLCRSSQRFNNIICLNQLFWMKKIANDFPIFRSTKMYQNIPMKYKLNKVFDYKSYYKYIITKLRNENYNQLLIDSSKNDDMILVKLSLEKGADIHVNNNEPLKVAGKNGHFNIIKFLVENGANVQDDVLGSAIWRGNLDIVKYLVNHGADVHERNDLTLAWASSSGNLNIVKYLLDHGVDIHANDDMAISWASSQGHLNVVKYLVSRGANIHTPGTLYHAHLKNQSEVVDYLISQGAKRYKKYFY